MNPKCLIRDRTLDRVWVQMWNSPSTGVLISGIGIRGGVTEVDSVVDSAGDVGSLGKIRGGRPTRACGDTSGNDSSSSESSTSALHLMLFQSRIGGGMVGWRGSM